jgi:hypothetical protein
VEVVASNKNYGAGAAKPWGSEIRVNEFHGLEADDLPQPGDWVRGRNVAHELTEVTASKKNAGTVRYKAKRWPVEKIPLDAKVYDSRSNLEVRDY